MCNATLASSVSPCPVVSDLKLYVLSLTNPPHPTAHDFYEKKRTGSSAHSKATTKLYDAVYRAILAHVDFAKVKVVLLGSPGFQKDDFFKYLQTECVRREDRAFVENKGKFVLCRASSGHKHAIEEIFSDPAVVSRVTETKLSKEIEALNKFMRLVDTNPDKAYYGYFHVLKANEELAIDSLLITDELFRAADVVTRKKYVSLVESVRENGGTVHMFSTMHVSGQQLQQVSGVAAILRYPLPDLQELEEVAAAHLEDAVVVEEDDEDLTEEVRKAREEARVREDMKDMGFS